MPDQGDARKAVACAARRGTTAGVTVRIDHYDWAGGREMVLRAGPPEGPAVAIAAPLFEEANRTRALLVDMLRRLGAAGFAAALPDLPGQNESAVATQDARLEDWRAAFAAACGGAAHVVAMRGGALVDAEADAVSRWYAAPVSGASLIRELERVRGLGGGEDYAGNRLDPALIAVLAAAEPVSAGRLRVVRWAGDPRAADRHVEGAPLWRAAEPRGDAALAALLAEDIAAWVRSCAG